MKKKKIIIGALLATFSAALLTSCGKKNEDKKDDVVDTSNTTTDKSSTSTDTETSSSTNTSTSSSTQPSASTSTSTKTEATTSTNQEYILSFDFNGFDATTSDITSVDGVVTIPNLSTILETNLDKLFVGWSLDKDDEENLLYSGDTLTLTDATTLYAIWTDRYKVTYNMNGYGSVEPNQIFEERAGNNNRIGLRITTDALNADVKLADEVLIWTGKDFITSIITDIFIGETQYNDLQKGTENVTLLLRGIDGTLPEGSIIMITKTS